MMALPLALPARFDQWLELACQSCFNFMGMLHGTPQTQVLLEMLLDFSRPSDRRVSLNIFQCRFSEKRCVADDVCSIFV